MNPGAIRTAYRANTSLDSVSTMQTRLLNKLVAIYKEYEGQKS